MEKRLYDAAVRNDTATLSQLLQEDPTLLDSVNLNCEDRNALHLAAMLGNEAFVRAIFQANSSSSYRMCLARDRDGRNPIHLAAMYGKLNILNLLIHYHGLIQAALAKTEGKGTILHLCVEHNQLEALKLLLEIFTHPELVCAKNEDGMTILHLAIYYDQNQSSRREMITCLINNFPRAQLVNIKNGNGKTALDLLLEHGEIKPYEFFRSKNSRRKLNRLVKQSKVDRQILGSLAEARALTGYEAKSSQEWHTDRLKWLETRNDTIMIVLALIATMAFQAMVSPPGGVWQDDSLEGPNPHRAGEAVLAYKNPKYYGHLIRANTVAFVSSLSTIIVLVRCTRPLLWYFYLFQTATWLSLAAMAITYAISFATVVPKSSRGHLSRTSEIVIIVTMVWGFYSVVYAWLFGILPLMRARRVRSRPSFRFNPNI